MCLSRGPELDHVHHVGLIVIDPDVVQQASSFGEGRIRPEEMSNELITLPGSRSE